MLTSGQRGTRGQGWARETIEKLDIKSQETNKQIQRIYVPRLDCLVTQNII